jgi:surface-anchored protein
MRVSLRSLSIAACAALAGASVPATAAPYQTDGHTDIRVTYTDGALDLFYYLDEGSTVGGTSISPSNPMGGTAVTVPGGATKIRYRASDLVTYVPDPPVAQPDVLEYPQYAFTGAGSGEPLWYIPFTQEFDRPWTGISTESVSGDDFSNVRYRLTGFDGPGQMSVCQFDPLGQPIISFQTSDGDPNIDLIDLPARTHAHYQWFFTAPGTYTIELTATGTLTPAAGGGTVSVADTFTFQVAPEPSSLAALALGAIGLLRRRSRWHVASADAAIAQGRDARCAARRPVGVGGNSGAELAE